MINYKVIIKLNKSKETEWVKWMKETHIRDVVNTGYFVDFCFNKINIIENGSPLDKEKVIFEVEYLCKNIDDYYAYRNNAARELQEQHTEMFGDSVEAKRVIYSAEDIFDPLPLEVGM